MPLLLSPSVVLCKMGIILTSQIPVRMSRYDTCRATTLLRHGTGLSKWRLPCSSSLFFPPPLCILRWATFNLRVDRVLVIVCHCKNSRELMRPVGLPHPGWGGCQHLESKEMVAPAALALPTEPYLVLALCLGQRSACSSSHRDEGLEPAFKPRSVPVKRPLCRDGSSWRIPAEKTLSGGGEGYRNIS